MPRLFRHAKGTEPLPLVLTVADDTRPLPRDEKADFVRPRPEQFEQIFLREAKPIPAEMLYDEWHQFRQIGGLDGTNDDALTRALRFQVENLARHPPTGQVRAHRNRLRSDRPAGRAQKGERVRVRAYVHPWDEIVRRVRRDEHARAPQRAHPRECSVEQGAPDATPSNFGMHAERGDPPGFRFEALQKQRHLTRQCKHKAAQSAGIFRDEQALGHKVRVEQDTRAKRRGMDAVVRHRRVPERQERGFIVTAIGAEGKRHRQVEQNRDTRRRSGWIYGAQAYRRGAARASCRGDF